jgi:hypothetical protein
MTQYRVRLQLDRLAELERKYRESHITVAEAREIFRLRLQCARRQASRAWLARGQNAANNASYGRLWRQANPGCW